MSATDKTAQCIELGSIDDGMTPSERLRKARIDAGFDSAASAAEAMGVSYGTYSVHENGSRGISSQKAALYARRFGVTPEWILYGRNAGEPTPVLVKITREVPVLGAVQAGAFAPIPDNAEIESMIPLVLPAYESASLYALRVVGDSMNQFYPDGTLVVVAPVSEIGVSDGDHVIVRHMQNGMAETTVKELKAEKGAITLLPRSSNPAHRPVKITRQTHADDGYEIIGVVVSAYTVRPPRQKPLINLP